MAQNFWLAIIAWTVCFCRDDSDQPRDTGRAPDEEMVGLVYSLTPKMRESLGPVVCAARHRWRSWWEWRA